MQHLMTLYL